MAAALWNLPVPDASAKAARKQVTVYRGASKTLKVKTKKKVKWKTSNKKIAAVSRKGKVKGKKGGSVLWKNWQKTL